MYWSGVGSAQALAWGEVSIGMSFVGGPQWPSFSAQTLFSAGVIYTVTAVYHQPDLPLAPRNKYGTPPLPWDQNAGFPNTVDSVGYVQFNNDLGNGYASAGKWVATTLLAHALRIS